MGNRYLNNEKGNTLLVILGLLVGAIFISFVFFDFFTTYASKRISQTSADAAVLAAANEIQKVYDEELKSEIGSRMDRLREVAKELVEKEVGDIEEEEEKEKEKEKEKNKDKGKNKKEEVEEKREFTDREMDAIWKKVLDKMEIPNELRKAVRYEYEEVNANIALKYFFKNVWYKEWFSSEVKEINDVACEAIRNAESEWTEAAKYFATKNGAEEDFELIFKGQEFKVKARVKKEASFITVDDETFGNGQRDVYAEAEASIKTPKDIDIKCN
ncbi:pilus assembly protein TadG-related protein [Lederbergia lenta]|uniref:pilus assembly protein TadG-related protein n=1 Tax=Lederbergia lenta TaxID=1467 RepID=UPI0020424632|nr:pilus assembly protein TadG-related protein [Lederbergia lenta]MCM3113224.1 pilus assembly protein TadG-related protein [Lederbergia lenta]